MASCRYSPASRRRFAAEPAVASAPPARCPSHFPMLRTAHRTPGRYRPRQPHRSAAVWPFLSMHIRSEPQLPAECLPVPPRAISFSRSPLLFLPPQCGRAFILNYTHIADEMQSPAAEKECTYPPNSPKKLVWVTPSTRNSAISANSTPMIISIWCTVSGK